MGALPTHVMSAAPAVEDEHEELLWLRAEWLRQRLTIEEQAGTIRSQQQTIAELTGAEPGAAPSMMCLFWLYAPTRWHERHWKKVRAKLLPFVEEYASLPATEATPLIWDAHRTRRLQLPTHLGKPPSDRTLNFSLIEVKALLNWAVDRDMIKRNPLRKAKQEAVQLRRETKIPPLELDKLLEAAGDVKDERVLPENDDGQMAARLQAFILCCHDSMLRHGETAALREDRIYATGVGDLLGQETKGKRARVFGLTPRTLEALARVKRVPGSPYLLGGPDGKPYTPNTWRRWFRRACEAAGLDCLAAPGDERVTIRDLRPSGATVADEAGARPSAIKVGMGHASLVTTEKYLRSEDVANALSLAKKMTEAYEGRRPAQRARTKKHTR